MMEKWGTARLFVTCQLTAILAIIWLLLYILGFSCAVSVPKPGQKAPRNGFKSAGEVGKQQRIQHSHKSFLFKKTVFVYTIENKTAAAASPYELC